MNRTEIVETLQALSLPDGYWISTGAAMVLHGVREQTHDIDIGCDRSFMDELAARGIETEMRPDGNRRAEIPPYVEAYENWGRGETLFIEGLPVLSLESVIAVKRGLGRPKDYRDIESIEAFEAKEAALEGIAITRRARMSFSVIGMEGSSADESNVAARLWKESGDRFKEVEKLAKKDEDGGFAGFWGLMTDFSRSFLPWEENFTKGLYLAGVEADDSAEAPQGWSKWTVPSFEYLSVKAGEDYGKTFSGVLRFMEKHRIPLAGAVLEYNDPRENGQLSLYFPIRRLT